MLKKSGLFLGAALAMIFSSPGCDSHDWGSPAGPSQTPGGPTTLAVLAGNVSGVGNADGTGALAKFYSPMGVAVDGAGNVFVADYSNQAIRKITPQGVVTTVTMPPGQAWNFCCVAVDPSGNLFLADPGVGLEELTAASGLTTAVTIAGPGQGFGEVKNLAVDANGNLYVADGGNAGAPTPIPTGVYKLTKSSNFATATALAAPGGGYQAPGGVAVDANGNVFVTDTQAKAVYRISGSTVTTLGAPTFGWGAPLGVCVDSAGNVDVMDIYVTVSDAVLKID
jgi:sugar lactone lactonase YvrE